MDILEECRKFRQFVEQMAQNLDEETAEEHVNMFPNWESEKEYKADEKVRYKNVLYKVLQDHTSQSDWTPDVAVSLFVRNHQQEQDGEMEEYPEWIQPAGAHDAYNTGDKVTFDGKHYESLIDGNVWSPTDYPQGWSEIE